MVKTTLPIAKSFEFTSFALESEKREASFCYTIKFTNRPDLVFKEKILFPWKFNLSRIPKGLLEEALKSVHLMLGISYYKLYCPATILLNEPITKEHADFWNAVYTKGLGEFFYQNKIDPQGIINFPFSKKARAGSFSLRRKDRALVGVGGGKDSIVAGELLKANNQDVTAFLVETQRSSPITAAVMQQMNVPSLVVKRYVDEKIFANHEGSYNGHIPISAVFSFIGYLAAILYDYSYVVVGNEFSSNFGNVMFKGMQINHQWSKSAEYEALFQDYSKKHLSPNITYFSLLRPFHEIRVAKMFSQYKEYFQHFSSCNRSYKINKKRQKNLWCGQCPKCVFVFLMLAAFLDKQELLRIFGKNLFDEKELLPTFAEVLGFGTMKPFDCVGTFEESQAAIYLASKKFGKTFIVNEFLPKIKKPEGLVKRVLQVNAALTLPAKFKLLGLENTLILGYGKEGKVTKQYIKKYHKGLKIGIADQQQGPLYLEKQSQYELAIKTPGISKIKVRLPYTTATNLFFSQIKNTVIGVTGSKGKSTTSSLIYHILKEAGKKVTLLGNIGNPMLKVLFRPIDADEIFVIELSSYQLDDAEYSPNIAVILNFFPEHMDYHGNERLYYHAKKNIVKFQTERDYFIFNQKNSQLRTLAKPAKAQVRAFNGDVDLSGFRVPLIGKHNEENLKAAVTVAQIFNISKGVIKRAIERFQPLPHRLEFVGGHKGIFFYDDAISTTPESTMMALQAIKNVKTIFLGGQDRGYDFSALEKMIRKQKIENVVLFPDSGQRIFSSKNGFNVLCTSSMKEAVEFAYNNTPIGSVCLLSTASPSYSVWKNFEEKGDLFKQWVKKLS